MDASTVIVREVDADIHPAHYLCGELGLAPTQPYGHARLAEDFVQACGLDAGHVIILPLADDGLLFRVFLEGRATHDLELGRVRFDGIDLRRDPESFVPFEIGDAPGWRFAAAQMRLAAPFVLADHAARATMPPFRILFRAAPRQS